MADSVKNPEPDFIAGKFADIDYTGVEHQILAFDTFQQAFHFRRFVQIMGFHLGRPYLNRIPSPSVASSTIRMLSSPCCARNCARSSAIKSNRRSR